MEKRRRFDCERGKSMRSDAREAAFKIIFAELFGGDCDADFKAAVCKKSKLTMDEAKYVSRIISKYEKNREEIYNVLSDSLKQFTISRVYPVDRAILFVALTEILYLDEVPPIVSASEAAALATKYSTEKSAGFVNGVLAGVINK